MKKLWVGLVTLFAVVVMAGCAQTKFAVTSGVKSGVVKVDEAGNFSIKGTAPSEVKYVSITESDAVLKCVKVSDGKFAIPAQFDSSDVPVEIVGTAKKQIENGAILSKDVLHKLKYKSGKFDDSEGEGTTNDDESDSSDDSSEDTTSSTPYEIGQEAKLSDGSGNQMWGLKLTSATKNFNSSGQNLVNSDIDTIAITNEKSVQFSFNYTNYGDSESYLPTIWDFTVYDQSGTAGEIVDQQDGQNEVSIGHNGNTTFWVNFTSAVGKGDKVTLEYQPDGLDSPITFEATVN